MRGFAKCAAAGTFVALAGIYMGAQAPATPARDAGPILAAARQALGGDKRLTAVKTFTASGRTKLVRGENLVPAEFEIFVELPDKFVRKDEVPAQETGITAAGFNGDDLIQEPALPPAPVAPPGAGGAPAGGRAGSPPNPSAARVAALKQDFARLTLGMFASSFSAYPLTFAYVGVAEAPQGKADVVDAKGPDNFALRLFIARDTHLPVMVSWQSPQGARGARGAPAARGADSARGPESARGAEARGAESGRGGEGARGREGAPGGPPENTLYFAEYRDVDGVQFPFRLRRAIGADTIEETTFDRFRVNVKIDPKRFEVRK